MASQPFQLVMRSGPSPGKVFELSKSEVYIGRDNNNEIVINDTEVSRKHARLVMQAGGYMLEDLGSTNGTFVNGQRLMGPHVLRPGELVMLGENVSLAFEAGYDVDATMVAASAQPPPFSTTPAPPPGEFISPAAQPAASPSYPGDIPPGPDEPYYFETEPEKKKGNRPLIFAAAGCGLVLVCLVVVTAALFYIDAGGQDRWCEFLGFLFSECP